MKSVQSTPYFSAYPLKALNLPSNSTGESNSIQSTKVVGRLRVMPMINPYPAKAYQEKKVTVEKVKKHDDIVSSEQSWYNNYE